MSEERESAWSYLESFRNNFMQGETSLDSLLSLGRSEIITRSEFRTLCYFIVQGEVCIDTAHKAGIYDIHDPILGEIETKLRTLSIIKGRFELEPGRVMRDSLYPYEQKPESGIDCPDPLRRIINEFYDLSPSSSSRFLDAETISLDNYFILSSICGKGAEIIRRFEKQEDTPLCRIHYEEIEWIRRTAHTAQKAIRRFDAEPGRIEKISPEMKSGIKHASQSIQYFDFGLQ